MINKIACILSSFLFFINSTNCAPEKNLWAFWDVSNENNSKTIKHAAYQEFLNRYVVHVTNDINLIHYSKVLNRDKEELGQYIQEMASLPIRTYSKQEQLAYWINLYNALTIQLILEHWPVKSITNIKITPGYFSFGPWDAPLITIEGQRLSLNDIEHRILRPIWNNPMLHYALNCASKSCPQLQDQVFTAQNSQDLMRQAAREYVNSAYGVNITQNKLRLSKIYEWYQADFGANESQVLKHIAQYAQAKLEEQILNTEISIFYYYNWDINGY